MPYCRYILVLKLVSSSNLRSSNVPNFFLIFIDVCKKVLRVPADPTPIHSNIINEKVCMDICYFSTQKLLNRFGLKFKIEIDNTLDDHI